MSQAVSVPVVASGGAGRPEHLADAILLGRADAALAASIFHFGEYTILETKAMMATAASRCDCGPSMLRPTHTASKTTHSRHIDGRFVQHDELEIDKLFRALVKLEAAATCT